MDSIDLLRLIVMHCHERAGPGRGMPHPYNEDDDARDRPQVIGPFSVS
jgi:hypothetical protein